MGIIIPLRRIFNKRGGIPPSYLSLSEVKRPRCINTGLIRPRREPDIVWKPHRSLGFISHSAFARYPHSDFPFLLGARPYRNIPSYTDNENCNELIPIVTVVDFILKLTKLEFFIVVYRCSPRPMTGIGFFCYSIIQIKYDRTLWKSKEKCLAEHGVQF